MGKVLGIFLLLVAVCVITGVMKPQFVTAYNLQNTVRWASLFGILSIGVAFVIITGGIDLSIGSVVGLVGCIMPLLLVRHGWPWPAVLATVLGVSVAIGVAHGLLITKLGLQPFVVTLCGLLIYRGLGRWVTDDRTMGFGSAYDDSLRRIATERIPLPWTDFAMPISFVIMGAIALGAMVFLHRTVWGRRLFAVGSNAQAARYAGINTHATTIMAYAICSGLAGVGGVLFALDVNVVQPASHGNFYELYAIAGAVLGGCSLRGGEGSVLGVVFGAAVMRVLYNSINLLEIPTQLEFAIIGGVILLGVVADEVVRRVVGRRAEARANARAAGRAAQRERSAAQRESRGVP